MKAKSRKMNNQQCKITRLSILIESQNHINNNNNKLSVVFSFTKVYEGN